MSHGARFEFAGDWVNARCECGWFAPPMQALSDAADAYGDHRAAQAVIGTADAVKTAWAAQSEPKLLTEDEASWHQLADESMAGPPARWSAAMNAVIADSGKWERWPKFSDDEGWWNARVAQSAIQNLYRCGFAVVAVDPKAIERIVADAGERTR